MASSCLKVARGAVSGFLRTSGGILERRTPTRSLCPSAGMCSAGGERRGAPGEEEYERPAYMPRKKAKNPMKQIGIAWMIGMPTGILCFLLAKRQVDKNRLKQLKIRQRMSRANEGEYEGSRYSRHAKLSMER